jgi:D-methionine transport system substrate-binding protein
MPSSSGASLFHRRRGLGGLLAALLLVAGAHAAHADDLRIGFMPGPYRDAFAKGIEPLLARKGYSVRYVEFSQGVQPNDAVERGHIDANIFQHSLYLAATNERQGFDLVPIVQVPTPPMGLYSQRHKSLDTVPDGATVTLPADPVNAARALNILAAIGWIELRRLRLVPLDAAQAARSLADADLAAVQGNYAVASGLKLTEALRQEDMTPPYVNVVAVKKGNENAKYARDIVLAYQSADFQQAFRANPVWAGYRLPDYFSK